MKSMVRLEREVDSGGDDGDDPDDVTPAPAPDDEPEESAPAEGAGRRWSWRVPTRWMSCGRARSAGLATTNGGCGCQDGLSRTSCRCRCRRTNEWRFRIHVTVFPGENAPLVAENVTCLAQSRKARRRPRGTYPSGPS